jgi:predicted AlkP superfamily pyrophosphatase or phosphodiesterase
VDAATSKSKDRTVVVISLDGFPAYALDDPKLPIPTLRKLIRDGAAATSMRPVNPTVTWPNHTSIVTGVEPSEHQVLYNGLLLRPEGGAKPFIEPWRDKEQMVHARTIYDAAFEAGLTTAQVDWVAIYGAKSITWQFPEIPDPDGVIERELVSAGTVTAEQLRTFEASTQAWQDNIWTAAAEDILEKYRPNLLLLHLLTLDDTNHEYGPMTNASLTAMAFLDAKVKQIVDAIAHAGLSNRATLIVVSDHGFRTYKHKIQPNALLLKKGLLSGVSDKPSGDAWVMPEGGTAMVYVKNSSRRTELVPELRAIFSGAEGISAVYGPEEFRKLGLPTPKQSDQAPDLVLAAEPGYMFTNESKGEFITQQSAGGTHGYLNTDVQMQAIFIASGAEIPTGIQLGNISNLDVAPTIAALLGIELRGAKGHALEQIVKTSHITQNGWGCDFDQADPFRRDQMPLVRRDLSTAKKDENDLPSLPPRNRYTSGECLSGQKSQKSCLRRWNSSSRNFVAHQHPQNDQPSAKASQRQDWLQGTGAAVQARREQRPENSLYGICDQAYALTRQKWIPMMGEGSRLQALK